MRRVLGECRGTGDKADMHGHAMNEALDTLLMMYKRGDAVSDTAFCETRRLIRGQSVVGFRVYLVEDEPLVLGGNLEEHLDQ